MDLWSGSVWLLLGLCGNTVRPVSLWAMCPGVILAGFGVVYGKILTLL